MEFTVCTALRISTSLRRALVLELLRRALGLALPTCTNLRHTVHYDTSLGSVRRRRVCSQALVP
jgi:hypothetical protein